MSSSTSSNLFFISFNLFNIHSSILVLRGEVIAMPEGDLLKIRNFGRKSLDELFDVLAERNMLPESS